jgi:hypothetical protein
MSETPKEKIMTIIIRRGRSKILELRGVPEIRNIRQRGTREKTK